MAEEPEASLRQVVLSQETEEDAVLNISLRPQRLEEFVGQRQVKENLKIALEAARQRGEAIEHVLLSGPPGLGKTTLAHIIANDMGAKITATSGPAIVRAGDLIGVLTNLGERDVLFVDEIHRFSKPVEEFLYPAMENYEIDFVIDKGPYAKTIKFRLKRFTLIGATTRAGMLSSPLRSRFGLFYHLDFYEPEDLATIVERSSRILGVELADGASREIARRARGTPRIANRLLRRARDYAQVKGDGRLSVSVVKEALQAIGIDEQGLDQLDRKVLQTIITVYEGGPVGVEALAASLNEEPDTLVDVVEPYLLKVGFIRRTPRGREVTSQACQHLGSSVPAHLKTGQPATQRELF